MTQTHHLARCLALLAVAGCSRSSGAPVIAPQPIPVPLPTAASVVAAPAPRTDIPSGALQPFVDSLVTLPQFASAHWGILLVDPVRRDTLAATQPDRLVLPASNQKLITAAVGLAQLGPDHRWRTTVTRTGPIRAGVLRGDLVVAGTGDPSISSAMRPDPLSAFDPLVAALRAAGVTTIAGDVRTSDQPAFPGSPLGFGWEWDDLDGSYGAGVTEVLFNEAFTDVTVTGCRKPGSTACVTTAPLRTSPVTRAQVTIRNAGSGAADIQWWRDSARVPGITIRGSIAAGDSVTFSAAQPDGRGTYRAAVREALARAGIRVRGMVVPSTLSEPVTVLTSLPLRDVLGAMQKPSQNQIAEVLFRTLGLVQTGTGTPDSARAVVERQLTAWGVRADAHAVRDGSGLSRHDYLTPRAIVQVLDTMRRSPTFAVFRDALPTPGTDGTLQSRMRLLPPGRVFAKTGTIDKARALSGYAISADGDTLLFSIIANSYTVPTREVDRIAELIVERLVQRRQGGR